MTTDRKLSWDGCPNARDLGGLQTASGSSIRRAALIRSDNFGRLTEAGIAAVEQAGVSLVIDLRSAFELEIEANPFATRASSVTYRHLPLINDADAEGLELVQKARDATEMYEVMLERFKPQIGAILQAIADAPSGAVVVHCHAGKDRTGLVVALSLALAGVSADVIAEDYALSDQYLQALYEEMLSNQPNDEARAQLAALLTSKPESILGALQYIEHQFGGLKGYLESCGLNAGTLERLRSKLLEA